MFAAEVQTSAPFGMCHRLSYAMTPKATCAVRRRKQKRSFARSKDNGAGEGQLQPLLGLPFSLGVPLFAYKSHTNASVEVFKTSHTNGSKPDEPWENLAFPTYLQSEVDDFCQDWDEALQVPLSHIVHVDNAPAHWSLSSLIIAGE